MVVNASPSRSSGVKFTVSVLKFIYFSNYLFSNGDEDITEVFIKINLFCLLFSKFLCTVKSIITHINDKGFSLMFKSFMKLIIGIAHVEVVVNFVEGIIKNPEEGAPSNVIAYHLSKGIFTKKFMVNESTSR